MIRLLILLFSVIAINAQWYSWGQGTDQGGNAYTMFKQVAWGNAAIHVTLFHGSGDVHASFDGGGGRHHGIVNRKFKADADGNLQLAFQQFITTVPITWINGAAYAFGAHHGYYNKYSFYDELENGAGGTAKKAPVIDEANPPAPTKTGLKEDVSKHIPNQKVILLIMDRLSAKYKEATEADVKAMTKAVQLMKAAIAKKKQASNQAVQQYFNEYYDDEQEAQYMAPRYVAPRYVAPTGYAASSQYGEYMIILLCIVTFALFCMVCFGLTACIGGVGCYFFGQAVINKTKQNKQRDIAYQEV